jgi:hypothetical protein
MDILWAHLVDSYVTYESCILLPPLAREFVFIACAVPTYYFHGQVSLIVAKMTMHFHVNLIHTKEKITH